MVAACQTIGYVIIKYAPKKKPRFEPILQSGSNTKHVVSSNQLDRVFNID